MGKRVHRDLNVRGTIYPTVQAAARALGVCDRSVIRAVHNGTLHRVGLNLRGVEPMRAFVGGKRFDSVAEAAAHFGITEAAIYRAMAEGREHRIGQPQRQNSHRSRPIVLAGLRFATMTEASRAVGMGDHYVSQVLRKGGPRGRALMLERFTALAARRLAEAEAERQRAEGRCDIVTGNRRKPAA